MAELGNARDLKFVAPFEIHRIFCITRPETETKIDAKRRDLHNASGPSQHARRAPAPDVSVTLRVAQRGRQRDPIRCDFIAAFSARTACCIRRTLTDPWWLGVNRPSAIQDHCARVTRQQISACLAGTIADNLRSTMTVVACSQEVPRHRAGMLA